MSEGTIIMNTELTFHYMKTIQEYTKEIQKFNNERNWSQYHNPKDVAIALIIEAGEILEHFRFKQEAKNKEELAEEIADVFIYLLLLAEKSDINIDEWFNKKMEKNRKKYPVEKFYGQNKKYNEV